MQMVNNNKKLGDFLHEKPRYTDTYVTEKEQRERRKAKGRYSKATECFDFIYLINNWQSIVGKLLAQNTIAQKIQNATLYVIAKHPVFAQEIDSISPEIIKKIEDEVPALKNKIKKIKFSHSNYSWEEFKNEEKQKSRTKKKPHRFSPEYRYKLKQAEFLFGDIEDDEIKEMLTQLYLSSF